MQVLLHTQEDSPRPREYGFKIAPGLEANAEVTLQKVSHTHLDSCLVWDHPGNMPITRDTAHNGIYTLRSIENSPSDIL